MRLVDADAFAMYLQLVCKGNDMSPEKKVFSANGIIHMLQDMPTASDMKWIPLAEKMPNEGETVLTCTEDGDLYIMSYATYWHDEYQVDVPVFVTSEESVRWDIGDIAAWMPLPEPYEVKDETD